MFRVSWLCGCLVLCVFARPTLAATDSATQVGLALQELRHEDFLKKYLALPEAERAEAFTVLMTEMAAVSGMEALPGALFEKEDASFPRPLKQGLATWLEAPPSDKDYENLRYIGLMSKPDVKLKIEKAACDPQRTVAAEVATIVRPSILRRALCTMKTQTPLLYWVSLVPGLMEWLFDFDPCASMAKLSKRPPAAPKARCSDQIAVSLAAARADGEIREEKLWHVRAASFAAGLDAREWSTLRRKVWESAERLITDDEALSKTLASRLHVLELLPDADPVALQRRRKLVVFAKSAADAPDPRQDYCGWAETYSRLYKDPSFVREEPSCAARVPPSMAADSGASADSVAREPASTPSPSAPREPMPESRLSDSLMRALGDRPISAVDLPAEAAKVVLASPPEMWELEWQHASKRVEALVGGAGEDLSEPERERHLQAATAVRDELGRRLRR